MSETSEGDVSFKAVRIKTKRQFSVNGVLAEFAKF
jgi:hypothetical protein